MIFEIDRVVSPTHVFLLIIGAIRIQHILIAKPAQKEACFGLMIYHCASAATKRDARRGVHITIDMPSRIGRADGRFCGLALKLALERSQL